MSALVAGNQPLPRFTDGFMRIGAGPFGAKEESLNQYKPDLKECGFLVPRTVTIGWSSLRDFDSPTFVRIASGAHKGLGSPEYFAARSSAMGDNTGTGIFHSALFRYVSAEHTAAHLGRVAASHDSVEALCFRRELGLREGIAAMMQPIAGDYFDVPPHDGNPSKRVFGPLWSGIVSTQMQQLIVMNPGLLRPETSANKTILDELRRMKPDSKHTALLFDANPDAPSGAPVDIGIPGNMLLQREVLDSIDRLPERIEKLKGRIGADFYAEICFTLDGHARVVQFAPLPPLPQLSSKPFISSLATEARMCRGAVMLKDATALVVTDYLPVDRILETVDTFARERGVEGRSLVVLFEDNVLRDLMSETRELWGRLKNVGALLSIDLQEHTAPFECHLTGAMRLARGFGYGRLDEFPQLGDPDEVISCGRRGRHPTQVEVHKNCVDVEISEGHGVGYIARRGNAI